MAKQRLVETAIWQDGWFLNLSSDAKLLFLHVCTSPLTRESGFLELPDSLMVPYLYSTARLIKARKEVQEKLKHDAKNNLYLLINFYFKNCKSPKMIPGALNDLRRFRNSYLSLLFVEKNKHIADFINIRDTLSENADTLSIGCNDNDNDNDNDNIKKEDINNISIPELDFGELWELYPSKTDKRDALERFTKTIKTQEDYNNLKKAIINYDTHQKNLGTELKYIKHFATFLNKDRWKEWVNFTKQDSLREQGIGQIRDDFKLPEEIENEQIQF
jgi:hypothetical protein